jgi:hypothetical protein
MKVSGEINPRIVKPPINPIKIFILINFTPKNQDKQYPQIKHLNRWIAEGSYDTDIY